MTRHLLGAMGMDEWRIGRLLERADALEAGGPPAGAPLAGRLVALCGDAPLPATHAVAASRLGAATAPVALRGAIPAMAASVDALSPDLVVAAHSLTGVPSRLAARLRCPVLGAGDGAREDLPGALSVALALRRALGAIQGRHVALAGDVLHSGLARSALIVLGALGARLRLVAPSALLPPGAEAMGAAIHAGADEGVRGAEAIVALPLSPRAVGRLAASASDHEAAYATNPRRLALAAPDAIVVARAGDGAATGTASIHDPSIHDVPVLMALMLDAMGIEP